MPTTEMIAFEGPLGTLRGVLHRPDAAPAPGVILLHGFTGQHIEHDRLYVQAGRALAGAGFAALRFDFYGSGDSDGEFDAFTVDSEVADAVAALDWIAARPEIDATRLGAVGLSLGGAIAALLAGQDARVKAAVLWNAVAFTSRMAANLAPGPHGGLTLGAPLLDSLRRADPVGALARFGGPALVIHATGDEVVPMSDADAYAAVLNGQSERRWFEGGSHTFTHPQWRPTVFDWTIDWFRQHLPSG